RSARRRCRRPGPAPWNLALGDRDVRGARGARVLRAGPDQPVVAVLLEHVSGPARYAAHREDRRELIGRNSHGRVARAGEEVDVRVDVLLFRYHARHGVEDLDWAIVADLAAELGGEPAQVLGARVFHAIDAMAEAHEPHLVRDGLADPRLRLRRILDLVDHQHHLLVGAAVQRTLERADGGRDGRV